MDIKDIIFKIIVGLSAVFYYLYSLVISKQVKIMNKTLEDEHNRLILLVSTLQVTVALIILIIALLSIFIF
ncbi:MAG: DUF5657 family protein [Patescibacteria group bacterium]|jgi:hypothetical protein